MKRALVTLLLAVCCLACDDGMEREARARLASTLRDSVGAGGDPQVAFRVGRNHLLVHMDARFFETLSDSAFAADARSIAQLSLRHYEKPNSLDSVTVETRDIVVPGKAMRIRQSRAFSVAELAKEPL